MSQFWDAATAQAGREFGARHYRWFVGVRVLRRILPAVCALAVLAAAARAAVWLYASINPDWAAIGTQTADGAILVALWLLGAALGMALAVGAIVAVRRSWWRWWNLSRPSWRRRY